MKKILNSILLTVLITNIVTAQCINPPLCTQEVILTCTDISNQNINGSPCFKGSGIIPTSYNINNALFYSFDGGGHDSTIYMYQNVNLQNNRKVFCQTGKTILYGNLSMSGSDTLVCYNNTETVIAHLIPNNGGNTIVLSGNATIKVGPDANSLVQYYPGDVIHTVPGNPSNDVKVVACTSNIPLAITIVEFKLYHNTLFWKVIGEEKIEVQLETVSNSYHTIKSFTDQTNSLEIRESGNYRLKVGGNYSKIIPYELKVLSRSDNIIYYYNNQFTRQRPNTNIVGQKTIK